MRLEVRVLGQPAVAAGFRLAGVRALDAADPSNGTRQLRALLDDPTVGVILVEDRLHAALPEALRRDLARRPLPMVVPFPGPSWAPAPEGPEGYIAELLRQAIGYRVRFR